MATIRSILGLICILALALVACSATVDLGTSSASTPTRPLSAQDNVATMVAQTLQAYTRAALSSTPANTPVPSSTATPTNTAIPPTLSVSVATNCYAGPRTNYGFVITVRPGTIVTAVGKDTADNYWIIDVPGYPGTVCWLSGQYASVSGDSSSLLAPATPELSKYTLSEPSNLRVSCWSASDSGTPEPWWHHESETTVTFHWTNTDPDQNGVRVYRNGWRLATLGAHASSYTDTLFHDWRHGVTYGVQAFNGAQVSSIVTIDLRRCR